MGENVSFESGRAVGNYRLVTRIKEEGARAALWVARHELLGCHRALRELVPPSLRGRKGVRGALLEEMKVLAEIHGVGVLVLQDLFSIRGDGGGDDARLDVCVFEWPRGAWLLETLESRGVRLAPFDILQRMLRLAEVMEALENHTFCYLGACRRGMLHGDLGPSTVLFCAGGGVRIFDMLPVEFDEEKRERLKLKDLEDFVSLLSRLLPSAGRPRELLEARLLDESPALLSWDTVRSRLKEVVELLEVDTDFTYPDMCPQCGSFLPESPAECVFCRMPRQIYGLPSSCGDSQDDGAEADPGAGVFDAGGEGEDSSYCLEQELYIRNLIDVGEKEQARRELLHLIERFPGELEFWRLLARCSVDSPTCMKDLFYLLRNYMNAAFPVEYRKGTREALFCMFRDLGAEEAASFFAVSSSVEHGRRMPEDERFEFYGKLADFCKEYGFASLGLRFCRWQSSIRDGEYPVLFNMARFLAIVGDHKGAIRLYRRILERNPYDLEAVQTYSALMLYEGHEPSIVAQLLEAVLYESGTRGKGAIYGMLHHLLALCHARRGNSEKAAEERAKARKEGACRRVESEIRQVKDFVARREFEKALGLGEWIMVTQRLMSWPCLKPVKSLYKLMVLAFSRYPNEELMRRVKRMYMMRREESADG